jgi:hypothetical protein
MTISVHKTRTVFNCYDVVDERDISKAMRKLEERLRNEIVTKSVTTIPQGIRRKLWSQTEVTATIRVSDLVPGTGLEPARLAALDPKSSASANSAIPALATSN